MRSYFQSTYNLLRQYKFGAFRMLLNRLFKKYFYYQTFFLYEYNLQWHLPPPSVPDVEIKKISDPTDPLFRKFQKKYPAAEFLHRIKKDTETAFIALEQGRVVAYAWTTEEAQFIDEIDFYRPLGRDELFLYSCFVDGESRGKGVHSLLLYHRLKECLHRNKATAYTAVISTNIGSIKGIERVGFQKVAAIKYLRIFSWQKHWQKQIAPGAKTIRTIDVTDA